MGGKGKLQEGEPDHFDRAAFEACDISNNTKSFKDASEREKDSRERFSIIWESLKAQTASAQRVAGLVRLLLATFCRGEWTAVRGRGEVEGAFVKHVETYREDLMLPTAFRDHYKAIYGVRPSADVGPPSWRAAQAKRDLFEQQCQQKQQQQQQQQPGGPSSTSGALMSSAHVEGDVTMEGIGVETENAGVQTDEQEADELARAEGTSDDEEGAPSETGDEGEADSESGHESDQAMATDDIEDLAELLTRARDQDEEELVGMVSRYNGDEASLLTLPASNIVDALAAQEADAVKKGKGKQKFSEPATVKNKKAPLGKAQLDPFPLPPYEAPSPDREDCLEHATDLLLGVVYKVADWFEYETDQKEERNARLSTILRSHVVTRGLRYRDVAAAYAGLWSGRNGEILSQTKWVIVEPNNSKLPYVTYVKEVVVEPEAVKEVRTESPNPVTRRRVTLGEALLKEVSSTNKEAHSTLAACGITLPELDEGDTVWQHGGVTMQGVDGRGKVELRELGDSKGSERMWLALVRKSVSIRSALLDDAAVLTSLPFEYLKVFDYSRSPDGYNLHGEALLKSYDDHELLAVALAMGPCNTNVARPGRPDNVSVPPFEEFLCETQLPLVTAVTDRLAHLRRTKTAAR